MVHYKCDVVRVRVLQYQCMLAHIMVTAAPVMKPLLHLSLSYPSSSY